MDVKLLAILVPAVLLIAALAVWLAFSLLKKRRSLVCPQCKKAWVKGFHRCPFCGYTQHTPYPMQAPGAPERGPFLRWCEGAPTGAQDIPLQSRTLTIGRGRDCDVHIESLLVSRHHAHLTQENNEWVLYDDDSTNGSYVNGQRVARAVLRDGDRLRIGPAQWVLQREAGPAARPLPASPPPPRPPARPLPSPAPFLRRIGNYTVIRQLGGGGMASVFLALTPQQQQVAIKVFFQTDPYLVQKFRQEGGLQLHHPHIVQVLDSGYDQQTMYLVMEYVEGTDLRNLLANRTPLPLELILPVMGQTCSALDHAHQQRIIHRDIKPENIRLSPSQGVKLLDFGIAKVTSAATITSDGMLIGTPYYMSFEQARGEPVVPASDVYSLGVVLYEMLTGRVPFEGIQLDVIHKHLTAEPRPPRQFNPTVTSEMQDIVLRCLAKDTRQRFASARALAEALHCRPDQPLPPFSNLQSQRSPIPYQSVSGAGVSQPIPLARFRVLGQPGLATLQLASGAFLSRRELNEQDLTISRNHAQILYQNGAFILQDCSLHGTIVDGQCLQQGQSVMLRPGALIQVGKSTLQFEGLDGPGG